MSEDADSTDGIPGFIGPNEDCAAFNTFWNPHPAHHLAYAVPLPGQIMVCVRVFDVFAAAVPVTENPLRYLGGDDALERFRFLVLDALSPKRHESSYADEQKRLAALMKAAQRFPSFDDPLC